MHKDSLKTHPLEIHHNSTSKILRYVFCSANSKWTTFSTFSQRYRRIFRVDFFRFGTFFVGGRGSFSSQSYLSTCIADDKLSAVHAARMACTCAARCSTLRRTAAHMPPPATRCNSLHYSVVVCDTTDCAVAAHKTLPPPMCVCGSCRQKVRVWVVVCCSVLQRVAVCCSVCVGHAKKGCGRASCAVICGAHARVYGDNTLYRTATQCNTLQHTATHCNTLQQTTWVMPHKREAAVLVLMHTCVNWQHTTAHCNAL